MENINVVIGVLNNNFVDSANVMVISRVTEDLVIVKIQRNEIEVVVIAAGSVVNEDLVVNLIS